MHGTDSGSRTVILSTNSRPRAINSISNTKRINLKQDLQITSSLNRQSMNLRNKSSLRLGRNLRPIFKV